MKNLNTYTYFIATLILGEYIPQIYIYIPRDCTWIDRTQSDSQIKKKQRNQLISSVNFNFLKSFADQIPSAFQEPIWRCEGAIFSGYGERQMEQNFQLQHSQLL